MQQNYSSHINYSGQDSCFYIKNTLNSHHLGNVLATVLDRKTGAGTKPSDPSLYDHWSADLASTADYYPGGMMMPGRNTEYSWSRMGYNGQAKDDEVYGKGNLNTALFWEMDTRILRRWNTDPKPDASISQYSVFGNNPNMFTDLFGDTTNYYNSDNGKFMGTIFGSSKYGDRFISESEFKKNVSDMNKSIAEGTKNLTDPKAIAAKTKELTAKFGTILENNVKPISTPLDMGSTIGLLSRIGFAEFRGSGSTEQLAGMDITQNRVGAPGYPDNLEGVIRQPWQYSSLNTGDPNKSYFENPYSQMYNSKGELSKANHNSWTRTVENASSIAVGANRGISHGATLYYSPLSMRPRGSLPKWNFKKLTEISIPGVDPSHIRMYKTK